MSNKKEFVYEDADTSVGGGQTGVSKSAAPVAKGKAGLPNSKDQGDNSPIPGGTQVSSGLEPEVTDTENNTKPTGTSSSANQGSLKPGSRMKEDMDALFGGTDLSEDFRSKALTIFEAAVNAQVAQIEEEIKAENAVKIQESVEEALGELTEKVDDYLNYVAEEWMKENNLAVESGIRAEMVESFLTGLKGLFQEHYVEIPEEDESVVESLLKRVEELESKLNEEVENNIAVVKQVEEFKAEKAISEAATGLTESQKDKFFNLVKGVSYDSSEELKEKIATIKESYFPAVKTGNAEDLITETFEPAPKSPTAGLEPNIANYVTALSRTVKK